MKNFCLQAKNNTLCQLLDIWPYGVERNWRCLLGHCVALPVCQTFIVMVAAMSQVIFGDYNPINALQQFAGGPLLVAIMLFILLGQWTTNVATSVLPGAFILINSITTCFKKKIPYFVACLLRCLIPAVVQPWLLLDQFQAWLGVMGSVYGPLAGVIFADYYLIRKRRVNVPDLYKKDGQFAGMQGWNWCGIIAVVAGSIVGYLSGSYAMVFGTSLALVVYYVMMKSWWIKKFPQAEIESNYDDKYLGISNYNYWDDVAEKAEI